MKHRRALYDIVQENQPSACAVPTTGPSAPASCPRRKGYRRVQRALSEMREVGDLPFAWIVDNGRRTYTTAAATTA